MKIRTCLSLLSALFLATAPISGQQLSEGRWRAEFSASGEKFPFVFEVKTNDKTNPTLYLRNGTEKVPLTGVKYSGDSIIVPIEAFDAELRGVVKGDTFEGKFIKHYVDNDPGVPFVAIKTEAPRFEQPTTPTSISPTGKWAVKFISEDGKEDNYIGIFEQNKDIVTGSFLTNSGDFRYLEGSLTQNGFELSAFAGLSPYLVKVDFQGKDQFTGEFFTVRGATKIIGVHNNDVKQDDPYSLTTLKTNNTKLDFTLPDIDGNQVSINDPAYKGKVVVVSILGSWCPNCLDEMAYLAPWYKKNKKHGVEIIGLAFERKDDFAYAKQALTRVREKYKVDYKLLFGGKVGEQATSKVLPQLTKIISYPTMIFIDKKGNVRKIHTGFNGPATGQYYEEFKTEFNQTINELLNE